MADNQRQPSSGIGFFGLLTIVFITLKLCGVIGWSWWWVLAPSWGGALFAFAVGFTMAIAAVLAQTRKRGVR